MASESWAFGSALALGGLLAVASAARAQEVIEDDLIVRQSLCVGTSCAASGTDFGASTVLLRADSLRLRFEDTSTSPGFPSADWELRLNDPTTLGTSYFGITDSTDGTKLPFRLDAGAPSNALRISSLGMVGLGTGTPTQALHIASGNTPTIRLEQTNAQNFAPVTWDIGGNEEGLFMRENGVPSFRIHPGAPLSTLTLHRTGVAIGVGSTGAKADLHVRMRQTVPLLVDTANATSLLKLEGDGDLTIRGSLTQSSSVHVKENFEHLDGAEVLDRVAKLNVSRWSYKTDVESTPHIGPLAEEFHAAFRVGEDAQHIAPSDSAGVALAAVQALYRKVQEQEAELKALRATMKQVLEGRNAPPSIGQ